MVSTAQRFWNHKAEGTLKVIWSSFPAQLAFLYTTPRKNLVAWDKIMCYSSGVVWVGKKALLLSLSSFMSPLSAGGAARLEGPQWLPFLEVGAGSWLGAFVLLQVTFHPLVASLCGKLEATSFPKTGETMRLPKACSWKTPESPSILLDKANHDACPHTRGWKGTPPLDEVTL